MGRIARVVVAGMAHHVTQQANRRQQTFFCDDDYRAYIQEMSHWCGECGVQRNPLRARLVQRAQDWPWSSAAAHIAGRDDQLVRVGPLLKSAADWPCTWQQRLAIDEDAAVRPILPATRRRAGRWAMRHS